MECEVLPASGFHLTSQVATSYPSRLQHYSRNSIHQTLPSGGEESSFRFITELQLVEEESNENRGEYKNDAEHNSEEVEADTDDDLYDLSDDDTRPDVSQICYSGACKMFKVTPSKHFYESLCSKAIILKNQRLGAAGARACAVALARNQDVEILNLEGNSIGGSGAASFAQALKENRYITELTLSQNCLGSLGAKAICEVLYHNDIVLTLNLSGNGFKETDAIYFKRLLRKNRTLRELNVSHNEFREEGGEVLADGLWQNDYLQKLDLSWNHLRLKGAVAIGKCLEANIGLKWLDVSWNGFHASGSQALSDALCHNRSLTHLDISSNRIEEFCLPPFIDAIYKNDTLKSLKMGCNSIGMDGAMSLVNAIDQSETSVIRELDLGMQCVSPNFVDVAQAIADRRRFSAKYGVVLPAAATYDGKQQKESDLFEGDNPMVVLMEFMRLQNLRLIDLFAALDLDGDKTVSHEEIRAKLQSTGVPLSETGIERLIRALDSDNSGTIDFSEMFVGQKEHKKTVQKLMVRSENVPWEETPVGKVSVKMQRVMDKRLIMRKVERAAAERYQREEEEKKQRLLNRKSNRGSAKTLPDDSGTTLAMS